MEIGQFKGYVLEEVIAYLIRNTGYDLITSAASNDPDIKNEHNGLVLVGRGSKHQIDVLGELKWIPAFSFPLRLMVEAKCRSVKTGIDTIRNSLGVLVDVNENYFTANDTNIKPRYRYIASVFSTSGFSYDAVDMAIAHQISIVDLSDSIYDLRKQMINKFSTEIFASRKIISAGDKKAILSNLRLRLRGNSRPNIEDGYLQAIKKLVRSVKKDYGELFIGMAMGGFMVILKADDNKNFLDYAKKNLNQDVEIHWHDNDRGKVWTINPLEGKQYELKFKLPQKLYNSIYKIRKDRYKSARKIKGKYFSKISIFYNDKPSDQDYIFNLKFGINE